MRTNNRSATAKSGTQYELEPVYQAELLDSFQLRFKKHVELARPAPIVVAAMPASDPLCDLARVLEFERFGLIETVTDDQWRNEFDAWESSSHFLVAIDTEKITPVGVLRGIISPAGFGQPIKTIYDAIASPAFRKMVCFDADGNEVIDLTDRTGPTADQLAGALGASTRTAGTTIDRTFVEEFHCMKPGQLIYDVATICSRPDASHAAKISPMLLAGMARITRQFDIEHSVTILRTDLWRFMNRAWGMQAEPLAGTGEFKHLEGEPFNSQCLYANLRRHEQDAAREQLRRRTEQRPRLGRQFSNFVDLCSDRDKDQLFLL